MYMRIYKTTGMSMCINIRQPVTLCVVNITSPNHEVTFLHFFSGAAADFCLCSPHCDPKTLFQRSTLSDSDSTLTTGIN